MENLIWGLGRLQTLLDRRDVEDIHIVGAQRPLLRLRDGTLAPAGSPVADSDDDLIAQLQHIAAHHGGAERAFSPAQPLLNMQLPDGSRLAAIRDVVPHPTVTIRRHRLVDVTLAELAGARHAVAGHGRVPARWSCGPAQHPGHRHARLGQDHPAARAGPRNPRRRAGRDAGNRVRARPAPPGRHPAAGGDGVPPGSTELDPATGRRAGEITLSDLLHHTLRMSVTRVIIGEVRGAEALPMLEAMNAGMPGSMCTLHAGSGADAMERLVTAAMKGAGGGWSDSFVTRLATQGIDYVVHLRHVPHRRWGPVRFVAEIAEVTDVTETGKVAMNRIFGPGAAHEQAGVDPRGRFVVAPQVRLPFDEAGVDLGCLWSPDVDSWTNPGRPRMTGSLLGSVLVFAGGAAVAVGVLLALLGARRRAGRGTAGRGGGAPLRDVWSATRPGPESSWSSQRSRWRVIAWCGAGVAVWSVTGWPVAGLAVSATGLWAPWLMGSGRVISDRLDRLEAVEGWCRRMADMLSGGGSDGSGAGHHDQRQPRRRGDR